MTLRKLALLGHPVLLTPAEPIADLADPGVQAMIDDMLATMVDADGIGLAAPQIHESVRLIVALELLDRAERETAVAHVLVNPELMPVGEAVELRIRGLSVHPGSARAGAATCQRRLSGAGPSWLRGERDRQRPIRARPAA